MKERWLIQAFSLGVALLLSLGLALLGWPKFVELWEYLWWPG
jgi:hypothetical protein